MRIAIDHDMTYDRDPELWDAFIKLAQSRGHEVVCVTKREPQLEVKIPGVSVIYCSRKSKRPRAGPIDIWIDDSPEGILFSDNAQVHVANNE